MHNNPTEFFSSRKKIFITGIAGFIGFHLARALQKRGDLVIGCDHFNHYYDPLLKRKRAEILFADGITVHELDILEKEQMQDLISSHQTTHLIHLAAQAGVLYSLQNPYPYLQSNIAGFVQILEICKANPHLKLIYASSSSVYGRNEKIPFSESDPTDLPANFYGASKKSNELMASAYHHLFGFSVIGLRFFTVYGPWGRPDMAYFSFTKSILEEKPISLRNEGKMQREFTYLDDIVQGTLAAIDLDAKEEIFNLGSEYPVDLFEFVSLIEEATRKKAHIHLLPMQKGEVLTTFADLSKSKAILNYHPKTSIREGVFHFVNWYQKEHSYV